MTKLKAVNDDLIYEFIQSGKYEILPCGTIKNSRGKAIGFTKKTEATLRNKQYRYVKYEGFELKIHRIIFAKFSKEKLLDDMIIHHVDSNGLNNAFENLRMCTQQDNCYYRYVG